MVWLDVCHHPRSTIEDVTARLVLDYDDIERAMLRLGRDGRLQAQEDGTWTSDAFIVPVGAKVGWEAAVFDHFQAVSGAILAKLRHGAPQSEADDRIFAGVSPGSSGDMPDPSAEARRAEQQAVVDLVRADLGRIRRKVGSEDYHKLDAHLDGLATLEQRLNSMNTQTPSASCSIPDEPPSAQGFGGPGFDELIPPTMDVIAHALACDVTRVASLQLSYGFSYVTHSWLGHTSQHHTMSHDMSERRRELQDIDNWYSKQFLHLLQKLDSFPEGDGTLLDNTLVVWGRELGTTAHRFERSPIVVAGGKNLGVTGGRFLNFDGQKHAKLLVSIANIMGLETNSVGNIDPSSGGLSGLV